MPSCNPMYAWGTGTLRISTKAKRDVLTVEVTAAMGK